MSHPKKDLQIICNIQWKSKPSNGAQHKVNIIGFCDMPATTLSWEHFKTYLLTNSGISDNYDEIIVNYITDDGTERAIQSQIDFQIALYTFRRHARMNEIIHLTLDKISDSKVIPNNSETRTRSEAKEPEVATAIEPTIYPAWFTDYMEKGNPPKWFIDFMQEFKNDILADVDNVVSGLVQNIKSSVPTQPSTSHHLRRCKTESKRSRKHGLLAGETVKEKDLSKMERKLESKLEKLEHKTKKIKEKKLALACDAWFKDVSTTTEPSKTEEKLSAASEDLQLSDEDYLEQQLHYHGVLVSQQKLAHVCAGEIYGHTWEISNGGMNPWTEKTELRFTWGSKSLAPLNKIVPCPHLKPGDTGKVTVQLIAPNEPGSYECYWHLYHHGKRFGDWFGCQVIVDPLSVAKSSAPREPIDARLFYQNATSSEIDKLNGEPHTSKCIHEQNTQSCDVKELLNLTEKVTISPKTIPNFKFDVTAEHENLTDDEDAHQLIEVDSSDDLSDDYEFCNANTEKSLEDKQTDVAELKVTAENRQVDDATTSKTQEVKEEQKDYDNNNLTSDLSSDNSSIVRVDEEISDENKDMVFISFDQEKKAEEFAYVLVDGRRFPIPKKFLKEDYLQTAEDAPNPCLKSEESGTQTVTSSANNESQTVEIAREAPALLIAQQDSAGNLIAPDTDHIKYLRPPELPSHIVENLVAPTAENLEYLQLSEEDLPKDRRFWSDLRFLKPELRPDTSTGRPCNCRSDENCTACVPKNFPYFPVHRSTPMGSSYIDSNAFPQLDSRLFIFPEDCPGYEVISRETKYMNGTVPYEEIDVIQVPQPETPVSNADYGPLYNYATNYQQNIHPELLTHYNRELNHVPNFQQTHPLPMKHSSQNSLNGHCISQQPLHQHENVHEVFNSPNYASSSPMSESCRTETAPSVHILPETLVTGAVNVASSAINTARSVINMIVPRHEPGRWVNGHWVSTNLETPREANLRQLAEMGFYNRDLNATLLARYNDDIVRAISELIQ